MTRHAALLFACALLTSAQAIADSVSLKSTAIRCRSEDSCKVAWLKALEWVRLNSQYKIRLANDYMIETYGPHNGFYGPGFTVQRVVIDGQIGIGLTTRCWTQQGIAGLFAIECASDEQSYLDSFVRALATPDPQGADEHAPNK